MPQDNVEVIRRIYEALARRDTASILALYDSGVELHFSPGTMADHMWEPKWVGHDGLRRFDRELRE